MISFGTLGILNPWLLAGLAALPILWWLLRAIPPRPKQEVFAGVRLLLGLEDPDRQAAKTPWWLLLMRVLAVGLLITGFAQLILNPSTRLSQGGDGVVLILMDQGWADAPDWDEKVAAAATALDEARDGRREVVLWPLASVDTPPPPMAAAAARSVLDGLSVAPWAPDAQIVIDALDADALPEIGQTIWIHDGLAHGDATGELAARLEALAPLRLISPEIPAAALTPPEIAEGRLVTELIRSGGAAETLRVVAIASTDAGGERRIAVAAADFADGQTNAVAEFDLPAELIGDVSRVVLASRPSPGGGAIADAAIQRARVTVVDPAGDSALASLTSASHYLGQALEPHADVSFRALGDALSEPPDMLVLADVGDFTNDERQRITDWVEAGGLLVRFAGPRLAAAVAQAQPGSLAQTDKLLPVTLRRGGRVLGGALAWGKPRTLGPFDSITPFRRLDAPEEVNVRTQVLAQPTPDLAARVWARLDDGTPLVTAAERELGRVVLFHVTADAEWSSLPLSGLFVEMLGRITALADGGGGSGPVAAELEGSLWRPVDVLDREGTPVAAPEFSETVAGERMVSGRAARGLPPGLYARADGATQGTGTALNLVLSLFQPGDELEPFPPAPLGAVVETLGGVEPMRLAKFFLGSALFLLLLDVLATLWLSGRLHGRRSRAAAALACLIVIAAADGGRSVALAQSTLSFDELNASAETTLGYVITGEARVDRVSHQALVGLSNQLTRRTAVEPGPPQGVDAEEDALHLYPVLYWPLTGTTAPTDVTLERLADYLTGGGLLIVDTQNGRSGFDGVNQATMRQIARGLNLPPLAPVDGDHVLSRTFYLLNSYPGRWRGSRVLAEAPPPKRSLAEEDADLPQFDRVDDNVSPVIVGSADWAAAWAVDERGQPMFPVGRPGDRQREMAIRFGVNIVMYALTGNYKSDQVHAPAVLQRLGQ